MRQPAPHYNDIPITTGTLIPTDPTIPPLVLKHTDIQATIIGPLCHVHMTQQFHNTHTRPVEALYVFPLPEDAAVTTMTLQIGDRTITSDIREREQAQQAYAQASAAGQGAALLEQERPNIFTVSVANIQPDQQVSVSFDFHDRVPYDNDTFEFVLPTVVLPRYTPEDSSDVPDADRLTTPLIPQDVRDGHTLSIRVELDAGSLSALKSPSHDIVTETQIGRTIVTLRQEDSIPNKDFILRYTVASNQVEAIPYTYRPAGQTGTMLLLLMPHVQVPLDDIFPREVLFVLDRSGSMGGDSMVQARNALRSCLRALNPGDLFNIFPFDDRVEQFSPQPVAFTQENLDRSDAYVESIDARGGTEILKALSRAFEQPRSPEHVRVVVFLTDGAVSNEDQVLRKLQKNLNESRVYAFGIGSAVNRFLLDKLAEVGRGSVEYIFPGQDIEEAVQRFQNRAAFPVLTDIYLDWGKAALSDVYPQPLPDLYAGQPLTILARFHKHGETRLRISGRTRRGPYEQTLTLNLPQETPDRNDHWAVLPRVWARARIDALMTKERHEPKQKSKVRDEILGLALEHRVLSPYTAFVAIEEHRDEHDTRDQAQRVIVPIHLPQGTRREAFEPDTHTFYAMGSGMVASLTQRIMSPPSAPQPKLMAVRSRKASAAPPTGATYSPPAESMAFDATLGISDAFARAEDEDMDMVADVAMSPEPAPVPQVLPAQRYDAALRYLARTQRVSGAWGDESSPETTALVLLAFVRGGHTDRAGDYRPQLQRAVRWLISQVQAQAPSLSPIVALALARLADATGADAHTTARDTALAAATATDASDHVCLALLNNTPPPALPALPDVTSARWALALAVMVYANEPIPDDVRTMLEQHQHDSGKNAGGVVLPGHSSDTTSSATCAATAVLALLCM